MFPRHAIALPIEFALIPSGDDGILRSLQCLRCGAEMEVHQPDVEEPGRLLATCHEESECGCWHVLDIGSDASNALLFLLPDLAAIRAAVQTTDAGLGRGG